MSIETILVTGGAGFIGSHMVESLLQSGYHVMVVDNESTGLRKNVPAGVDYFLGDVTRQEDVENIFQRGVDVVFHIAGQASTIRSFSEPFADLSTNIIGTLNILRACIDHRVTRLLYASSMTVYGHPESLPVSEDQAPRPISYYGITKYAAERYVISTAARGDLPFEFHVTAFRMFNVYGERQRLNNPYQGVLGFFLGNVLRNEAITIHSDGEQTRDFIYIHDVVDAWIASIDNPSAYNQVFNLGFGQSISINNLVDEILTAWGTSRKDYPIRYSSLRPGDQRHMVADIRKAQEILNYRPKVKLSEGLAKTIAWAKAEMETQDA